MAQMQREMDSLLGAFGMPSLLADPFDVFDRTAVAPLLARRAAAPLGGALSRLVSLEISDDDKGYTITAEVPGFQKNDIKVGWGGGVCRSRGLLGAEELGRGQGKFTCPALLCPPAKGRAVCVLTPGQSLIVAPRAVCPVAPPVCPTLVSTYPAAVRTAHAPLPPSSSFVRLAHACRAP